jgi:hypothetical protein
MRISDEKNINLINKEYFILLDLIYKEIYKTDDKIKENLKSKEFYRYKYIKNNIDLIKIKHKIETFLNIKEMGRVDFELVNAFANFFRS